MIVRMLPQKAAAYVDRWQQSSSSLDAKTFSVKDTVHLAWKQHKITPEFSWLAYLEEFRLCSYPQNGLTPQFGLEVSEHRSI